MAVAFPKVPRKAKCVHRRHVSDGFIVESEGYVSELRLIIVFYYTYRSNVVIVQETHLSKNRSN
jgi:hypothetical protein